MIIKIIIFIIMNPQVSPWMAIADRQRYKDLKRQHDERQLKNQIRVQYQKQLSDQINQQKQMKQKQRQRQKMLEKNMINASIYNQQRIIQIQKIKAHASNEKQFRMDIENDFYNAARKQRQEYLEIQNKNLQNQMHRQAEERIKRQNAENQRKKRQILQNLKQSIQQKNYREKYNKQKENEFQNKKLYENQMLTQRQEQRRQDYLRKLKQRALTIDYGSHLAFQKNHVKSLVQRKKQEWQNEHQYIRRAKQLQLYQDEFKRLKAGMENQYRSELQKQMTQKQHSKKYNSRRQVETDHEVMMRYQNYSKSVDMQKKLMEEKNKKQLLEYLQMQVQDRKKLVKEPYLMRDRQMQLNLDLLQNSKGIIPGQTYDLDPARKKQLETVAKSLAYSPSRVDKNYLAERGKTILH